MKPKITYNFLNFDREIAKLCENHTINRTHEYVLIQFPPTLTEEEIESVQLTDAYNMLYTFHIMYDCLVVSIVKSSFEYLKELYINPDPPLACLDDSPTFDIADEI